MAFFMRSEAITVNGLIASFALPKKFAITSHWKSFGFTSPMELSPHIQMYSLCELRYSVVMISDPSALSRAYPA